MPLIGYGVDDTQYMEDYHSPSRSVLHFKQYAIKPWYHHSGLSFFINTSLLQIPPPPHFAYAKKNATSSYFIISQCPFLVAPT